MKKTLLLFALMLFTQLFADIDWQKDLTSAFAKARQEHKVLMVMVEGEHCRWCKKMRYRTFDDARVSAQLSKKYICVRIDERSPDAVSKLPPVSGVPTIFFLTPDLKPIATSLGYQDAKSFMHYLSSLKSIQMQQDGLQ